jgi:hypothetical protein
MQRRLWALGLLVLAGCSSDPSGDSGSIQGISIQGTATLPDGSPLTADSAELQLVVDGSNLFTGSVGIGGCKETPAHVAGIYSQPAKVSQGAYGLTADVTSLHAAVDRSCLTRSLDLSQIEGITLKMAVPANDANCARYCATTAADDSSCPSDCSSGNRTLVGSASISAVDLKPLLKTSFSGVQLDWETAVRIDSLGPALTPGSKPDLEPDVASLPGSIRIDQEEFPAGSCEISDQCVRAPGLRRVLRFDGTINNVGDADLVIGSPVNNSLFQTSTCHKVPLLKNIMLYELLDPITGLVVQIDDQDVVGRKQGFCMMDIAQLNASSPEGSYNCDNQGITSGWADVYDNTLDCQFLDITDVPAGDYTLRLTVNPDGLFDESDTSNNSATVPVKIPDL